MLRRRPDNTFEYQELERTLYASTPAPLSPERRDALRARIFSDLGAQDSAPRALIPRIPSERWVTIPVGAGVAATIIAATHYVLEPGQSAENGATYAATAGGSVTVDGVVGSQGRPGQLIKAESPSWVTIGKNVSVGLEAGSSFTFGYSGDRLALLLNAGTHHVVSTESLLEVRGDGWTARMTGAGALDVSIRDWMTSIQAIEGETLVYHNGQVHLLRAGDPPLLIMNTPGSPGPVNGGPGNGPASSGPSSPGGPSTGAAPVPDPTAKPGTAGSSGPADAPAATGTPAATPPAADPGTVLGAPASDPPATEPAGSPAGTAPQGEGTPPEDPGYGGGNSGEGAGNTGEHPLGGSPGQGEGTPPAGEGSNAGGSSGANANPDSSAGGNSGAIPAPGSNNAGGVGGDNASPNSNAGGSSGAAGTGDDSAPGNSGESNAGGSSGDNANPNSNAGGSGSTGSGAGDVPRNSENSTAGGNSGSTGPGDEDAPGNSENNNAGGNSGKK